MKKNKNHNKAVASKIILASSSLLMTGCTMPSILNPGNQEVIAVYGVPSTPTSTPTITKIPINPGAIVALYASPGHFPDDDEDKYEVTMPILMYGVQTPTEPKSGTGFSSGGNMVSLMYGPAPSYKNFINDDSSLDGLTKQESLEDTDGIPTQEKFNHKN